MFNKCANFNVLPQKKQDLMDRKRGWPTGQAVKIVAMSWLR